MQRRIHPLGAVALSCLLSIVLWGCDDDGDGGSGGVSLLGGEPFILDSALAIAVSEDRPDGITDVFFSDEERIFLWLFWANVEGRHTVEIRWFSPEDDVDDPPFREETLTFSSTVGDEITWFFIDRPSTGFPEGEWFVEVFLDGLFERSHIFAVQ